MVGELCPGQPAEQCGPASLDATVSEVTALVLGHGAVGAAAAAAGVALTDALRADKQQMAEIGKRVAWQLVHTALRKLREKEEHSYNVRQLIHSRPGRALEASKACQHEARGAVQSWFKTNKTRDVAAHWRELTPALDFAVARAMTQMRPGYMRGYQPCKIKTLTHLVQKRFQNTPLWRSARDGSRLPVPLPPAEAVHLRIRALCSYPLERPASIGTRLEQQLCGRWSEERHVQCGRSFRQRAVATLCAQQQLPLVLRQWVVESMDGFERPAVLRKEGAFVVRVLNTDKELVPWIDARDTVEQLSMELEEREGVPDDFQVLLRLNRSGSLKQLDQCASLSESGVVEGSIVLLMKIARHHHQGSFLCGDGPMLVVGDSHAALEEGEDVAAASCVSLRP